MRSLAQGPAEAAGGALPAREMAGGAASAPHRVGLWLAIVVMGALAVFSLGVMVGKRVAESVPPAFAPPEALPTETLVPVAPSAAGAPAAAVPAERMSFYESLSGRQARGPLEVPESPAPASAEASPAGTEAGKAAAPPQPAGGEDALERARALVGRGGYRVQVAATPQKSAAEAAASRFRSRGFDVSAGAAVIKGKTWYRVRVGSFPDAAAAARAVAILREAGIEGLVVRE